MPTEIEAFQAFRETYLAMHPPPSMRALKRLDWKFIASLVWAFAAVITVAIITANEFYVIAVLNEVSHTVAQLRAGFSMLSVEGGVVIASAIKAGVTKKINPHLLSFSIYLMVGISVVAGLAATLKAVPGISLGFQNFLSYALLVVVGVGGSLVAWAAGEVMGQQIAITLTDRETALAELEAAMGVYEDELLAAWSRSSERMIVTKDKRIEESLARQELKGVEGNFPKVSESYQGNTPHWRRLSESDRKRISTLTQSEIQYEYGVSERTALNWYNNSRNKE